MDKNKTIFSALIPGAAAARNTVANTLQRFGAPALAFAVNGGVRVHILQPRETYARASLALTRLGLNVDAWSAPPAGLFVVEERTVYLRSCSPMTVSHEFGHALDCVLGGGVYRSGIDPAIRSAFAAARSFVTPYAATGLDEYFAEALRAYVGGCNDPASAWPAATHERLRTLDPVLYDLIEQCFQRFAAS